MVSEIAIDTGNECIMFLGMAPYEETRIKLSEGGFLLGFFNKNENVPAVSVFLPVFDTDDSNEIRIQYRYMICFQLLLLVHPQGSYLKGFINLLSMFPPQETDGEIEVFIKAALNRMHAASVRKSAAKEKLLSENHFKANLDWIWKEEA